MKTYDSEQILKSNEECIRRMENGDTTARDELIYKNMALVSGIVKRFLGRGVEYDDLMQIGSIGLINAANRFDTSFNVKFSTYAVPMIIGEIKRFIRDDGIIKVSRSIKETAYKAKQIKEQIIKKTGVEPQISEIAKKLSVSPSELSLALESQNVVTSIYTESVDFDEDEHNILEKFDSGENPIEDATDRLAIRALLNELCIRDRKIIILRYFKHLSQEKTAEIIGVSQVQISRIEKRILTELKTKLSE